MKRLLFFGAIFVWALASFSKNIDQATTVFENIKEPASAIGVVEPVKKISRTRQRREERKRRSRERAVKKTLSHKKYDELKKSKEERVAANDKAGALRYLEKMVPLCNDLAELKLLMLELADLLFALDDYIRAADMYREFTMLYPGSDEVEYALYRAILSNFKLTLDAEHDQSKTIATKELALAFLERSELFTTHKQEVEDILVQCEQRLLASDINVFNFYLKRDNVRSAQHRLDLIKKEFLNKNIPDVQLQIAQLEKMVPVELPVEVQKMMGDQTVKMAEAEQPEKQSFVDRF